MPSAPAPLLPPTDIDDRAILDLGAYADQNATPIRVWVFGPHDAPEGVLVVGHADGRCCPLVSKEMLGVKDPAVDAWVGYGFGQFGASDLAGRATLGRLAGALDTLTTNPSCAEQLHVLDGGSWGAWQGRGAELASSSARAYALAVASGRPVLLRDAVADADPPLLVPLRDAAGAEVHLEVREDVLAIPGGVRRGFSMDGTSQYTSWARAQTAAWEAIRVAKSNSAALEGGWSFGVDGFDFAGVVNCPDVRIQAGLGAKEITELKHRFELAGELLTALVRVDLLEPSAIAEQAQGAKARLEELDRKLAATRAALGACAAGRPDAAGEFYRITLHPTGRPEFLSVLDEIEPAELAAELASSRKELAEAEALAAESARSSGVEPLVDAFLRGWPATFGRTANETAFDDWMAARRDEVWRRAAAAIPAIQLSSGVDLERVGGFLHRSNVVFRVRRSPTGWGVTPYYLLAGTYVTIADPAAHVVRFESLLADQFLSKSTPAAPGAGGSE